MRVTFACSDVGYQKTSGNDTSVSEAYEHHSSSRTKILTDAPNVTFMIYVNPKKQNNIIQLEKSQKKREELKFFTQLKYIRKEEQRSSQTQKNRQDARNSKKTE